MYELSGSERMGSNFGASVASDGRIVGGRGVEDEVEDEVLCGRGVEDGVEEEGEECEGAVSDGELCLAVCC